MSAIDYLICQVSPSDGAQIAAQRGRLRGIPTYWWRVGNAEYFWPPKLRDRGRIVRVGDDQRAWRVEL